MKKNTKRFIAALLVLGLWTGGSYSVQAESIPNLFWRVVQKGSKMIFQYGNLNSPAEKAVMTEDGSIGFFDTDGIDKMPESSALLELESTNKAVLVTRVANENSITNPVNGMIIYVNNFDCFKVHQSGSWSECFGTAQKVVSKEEIPDNQGQEGDIYFNLIGGVLEVHNGSTWFTVSQKLVNVGVEFPGDPVDGQLFYNRDTNQFFIYNDGQWVELTTNFNGLISSHTNCQRIDYNPANGKQISCPNNQFATQIYYEPAAWSNLEDNLIHPEIDGIECCGITYVPGDPGDIGGGTDPVCTGGDLTTTYGAFTRSASGNFDVAFSDIIGGSNNHSGINFRNTPFKVALDVRILSATGRNSNNSYPAGSVSSNNNGATIAAIGRHHTEARTNPVVSDAIFAAHTINGDDFNSRETIDLTGQSGSRIYIYDEELRERWPVSTMHSSRNKRSNNPAELAPVMGAVAPPTIGSGYPWARDGYYNTYGNGFYVYVDNAGKLRFKYQTQHAGGRVVFAVGVQTGDPEECSN